jgi:deoxyxylulose-5-phosphate synthase
MSGPTSGWSSSRSPCTGCSTRATDRFVFDVSHQGYAHKLLTGRGGEFFRKLRQTGGASGFLTRAESPHDAYGAGHAGTALSAALGMATARDLRGSKEHVVAVCGDAAFTCGITMEALNNVTACTKRLIVILNDNKWSIARNVGAMAHCLNRLSTSPTYNKIHQDLGSSSPRCRTATTCASCGSNGSARPRTSRRLEPLRELSACATSGPSTGTTWRS